MKFKKLKFDNTHLIYPKIFQDNRGYFFESFNKNEMINKFININLMQVCTSFSKKNVLRGIHFQKKNAQHQIFYVAEGEIDLVLVDFRKNSKTFLKKIYLNINDKNNHIVHTPPGVGSGFLTKKKRNKIIYLINKFYNPKNEGAIIWNDKNLKINWKSKKPIVSKKDLMNQSIKEYFKL